MYYSLFLSLSRRYSTMMWVGLTIFAAFMQSWRNAFQSRLSADVSILGVTLARFIWAGPIAAAYLTLLYLWQPAVWPEFNRTFVFFVIGAAIMQIIATALMVQLFRFENYAVGAGLAKSEALVAAILGVFFFATPLSWLGWVGVAIGGIAVFILSSSRGLTGLSMKTAVLGLASGSAFALTSLWVREASLHVDVPFPHRAGWVLLLVISLQTVLLIGYLIIKDRPAITALWQRPRLTLLTSTSSCLGSIGWFSAMSLQAVPYVKTLGQVEIFFTMIISVLWLKQKVHIKHIYGLVLIAIAAIMVMWQ